MMTVKLLGFSDGSALADGSALTSGTAAADATALTDTNALQPVAVNSKLDPMAMLNSAMHRTKGVNKSSPRQTTLLLSPAGFNSTMIRPGSPRTHKNQTISSSVRKALF